MNEGVTIGFLIVFALVVAIGFVLVKEARTHRFWRQLVEQNDLEAIRGILDGEIDRWRTQRPPKDVSAAVWAGVQGMELLEANTAYVHLSTSAEAEFRSADGQRVQVASALQTAFATATRLIEMIFYDVPNYRARVVRVDVFTTFRDEQGGAAPKPILSISADREDAMSLDWNLQPEPLVHEFEATFDQTPGGEPRPIQLPPPDPALLALSAPPEPDEAAPATDDAPDSR